MALELAEELPVLEDFTLLSEHEQQTPGSFFGGKPVLHLRCPLATVKISREDLDLQPIIANLRYEQSSGEDVAGEEQVSIEDIDVWVSSSSLTLVSTIKSVAIRILYTTITVHAQEGSAVLLGLNVSDADTPDEDLVFIQLRILPLSIEKYEETAEDTEPQQPNGNSANSSNPAQALFKAIADCQELNPDPPDEGNEEDDETAPGATGWITSDSFERLQDFVDENGEFRVSQDETVEVEDGVEEPTWPLGQGAGRARTADERDAEDGVEEKTKWQRTD